MSKYQKKLRNKTASPLYKNSKLRKRLLETIPNRFHEEFKTVPVIQTNDPLLKKQIDRGWGFCGSISLAVSEILKLYQIQCRVRKCWGAYGNQAAHDLLKRQLSPEETMRISQEDEKVYILGFGVPPKNGQPDIASFHYVIEFADSLLDMTAIQSERVEQKIYAKNFWVGQNAHIPYLIRMDFEKEIPIRIDNNLEMLPDLDKLLQWISDRIAEALNRTPIQIPSTFRSTHLHL